MVDCSPTRTRSLRCTTARCWIVCVSSWAMSSRPAPVSGLYSPRPKKTWFPTVNALAFSCWLMVAACSPVWTWTRLKSAPKRGSMKPRTEPASGMPPEAPTWTLPVGAAGAAAAGERCTDAAAAPATPTPGVGAGMRMIVPATAVASRSDGSPGDDTWRPDACATPAGALGSTRGAGAGPAGALRATSAVVP